jgi:hypothetical protein
MKAQITAHLNNGKNLGDKKETISSKVLIAHTPENGFTELATCRWYMSRSADGASPIYCTLWVYGDKGTAGHGRATGYGYHKQSAAFQSACDNAGITLSSPVDGRGDSMVDEALIAIGEYLGYEKTQLYISRG